MTLSDINNAVHGDPGLAEDEKNFLNRPEIQKSMEQLLSGGAGAAIGVVVAKYLKLSKPVQVLLGVLGYGAGRMIYTYMKNYRPSGKYNDHSKLYEIDSKRY